MLSTPGGAQMELKSMHMGRPHECAASVFLAVGSGPNVFLSPACMLPKQLFKNRSFLDPLQRNLV
jgi:hypothetical protein